MVDTVEETPAQLAARLRRERRNAKIQASGAERLSKITLLNSGALPTPSDTPSSVQPLPVQTPLDTKSVPNLHVHDRAVADANKPPATDADAYTSNMNPQDFLKQMLHGGAPTSGPAQTGTNEEDSALRLMQQLLDRGSVVDDSAQGATESRPNHWKAVHSFCSLCFAIIAISLNDQFSGLAVLYAFFTMELVLHSTRYVFDKGEIPLPGIAGTMLRILPEPYLGYVRTLSRYVMIWRMTVSDAGIVIFAQGCATWYFS